MNATAEIREQSLDEMTAVEAEIQRWLGIEGIPGLAASYPQLSRSEGGATPIGTFEDDQLRSHAAIRRVTAVQDNAELEISLVGAVATDPRSRGQRFASRLLHEIANTEAAAGQDAIVLWSDLWEFYAKLGYALCGTQYEATIAPTASAANDTVREARLSDLLAIHDLHRCKPQRVERSLADTAMLFSVTGMATFVREREQRVTAYACCGKGVDLVGWWHELGGANDELAALLPTATTSLGLAQATVMIPPYRLDLLAMLQDDAIDWAKGIAGLVKPLSPAGHANLFIDGLDSI